MRQDLHWTWQRWGKLNQYDTDYSKPYTALVYKLMTYKSWCDYRVHGDVAGVHRSGIQTDPCVNTHVARKCSKTCTGVGNDKVDLKEYKVNDFVVVSRQNYSSKCAHAKAVQFTPGAHSPNFCEQEKKNVMRRRQDAASSRSHDATYAKCKAAGGKDYVCRSSVVAMHFFC